ncbi:hypothetical protein V2A60_000097 [Cordyceps javanica]
MSVLRSGSVVCSVNHGGANTYFEAVSAGVPQIVLPVWYDTYDFARRVEYFGIGKIGNYSNAPKCSTAELAPILEQVVLGDSAKKMQEKAATMAAEFASCTKPRDQKCGFFLTAADDAVARLSQASTVPPAPSTPAAPTRTQPWLTPGTGSSSRGVLFGGGNDTTRTRRLDLDDSPTSHRYRGGGGGGIGGGEGCGGDDGDDEADQLASLVIGLLRRDGVAIRGSTESAIRHAIGDRVAKYDAALMNAEKSLSFAHEKLDGLERGVAS